MIIKIQKASGSVELHDVTSITIVSTEMGMDEIIFGNNLCSVHVKPPVQINDEVCARRTYSGGGVIG